MYLLLFPSYIIVFLDLQKDNYLYFIKIPGIRFCNPLAKEKDTFGPILQLHRYAIGIIIANKVELYHSLLEVAMIE